MAGMRWTSTPGHNEPPAADPMQSAEASWSATAHRSASASSVRPMPRRREPGCTATSWMAPIDWSSSMAAVTTTAAEPSGAPRTIPGWSQATASSSSGLNDSLGTAASTSAARSPSRSLVHGSTVATARPYRHAVNWPIGAPATGRRPVPDSTTMRRLVRLTITGLVGLAAIASLPSCASSSSPQPTVASVNFGAKLVLEVDEGGFRWTGGDRSDPGVTVDPAAVPFGSVIRVVNTGKDQHRVDGGPAFDTGRLQPGDTTTVAFTADPSSTAPAGADGTTAQTYDIVDRDHPEHTTRITVAARPPTA